MKLATKILLITAAALILIGSLVFVGVLGANHWRPVSFNTAKYETETIRITEAFDSITIRSDTADLVFTPSEDGDCQVIFYDRPEVTHTAAVENGTLTVETKDTRAWYEHIGVNVGTPKITLCLPEKDYTALSIEEDTGDVDLPGDFHFESIHVAASTGNVACRASARGLTEIRTSTGDIKLEEVSAGELQLTVSTGRVDVRSVACTGNVAVTVSTGRATLTDLQCQNLTSGGSTGSITLENVIAAGKLSLTRSTGDVKLAGCDAAELEIETDTGDVTGTLCSEKVFIAKSDTGKIDLPETTTGGTCRITTDTGDVVIRIG